MIQELRDAFLPKGYPHICKFRVRHIKKQSADKVKCVTCGRTLLEASR